MPLKLIFFIIWLLIVAFLIWYFFLRKKKSNDDITYKTEEKEDIKIKFFKILIELVKADNLSDKDRNKVYDKLLEVVEILEKIEEIDIPSVKRYEIEKLIGDYLYRLILSIKKSKGDDIDKLLEGIDIIKNQLEKIYNSYIDNSLDLDREIEFLKRKFKSI